MAKVRRKMARNRLILLYFVAAAVLSFMGTFMTLYLLNPSEFITIVIMIVLPIGLTGSVVTLMTKALDDNADY